MITTSNIIEITVPNTFNPYNLKVIRSKQSLSRNAHKEKEMSSRTGLAQVGQDQVRLN